jgi:hypothetical protein
LSPEPEPAPESVSSLPVSVKEEPMQEEEEKVEESVTSTNTETKPEVTSSLMETADHVEEEKPGESETPVEEVDVEMKEPETTTKDSEESVSTETELKLDTEVEKKDEADSVLESKLEDTETEDKENSAANLERSLDGNAVSDTAPNFVAPTKSAGASIRINLTSSIEPDKTFERRESVVSNASDADSTSNPSENSDLDPEAIIQPTKYENAETKPKLAGRKLVEMPMMEKGSDVSGLCSIM